MKAYKCSIINPKKSQAQVIINGAILIDENGKIRYSGEEANIPYSKDNYSEINLKEFAALPGLMDLHNHIPQYPNTGLGSGELLDWLNTYIFPLEAKYDEYDFAYRQAVRYFESAIKYGTTTIVSYSTSSETATDAAFAAAEKVGINAFIGNTMMDTNSPVSIIKSLEENLNISKNMIHKWHKKGLLKFIITPRFAGSCSFELLKKCSELATDNDIYIQTHLSENKNELKFIASLFPDYKNYTDIYLKSGILTNKTLLAHCIYLSESELSVIKDKGAAISHCPSSNMFLKSGIMPLSNYLKDKQKICLGSDVAGGVSLSVFNEMSYALSASKMYQTLIDSKSDVPDADTVFNIATIESAQILSIENIKGSIEENKDADLIFINKNRIFDKNIFVKNEDILSKLIYSISNNYVDKTMIKGEFLFEKC